MTKTYSLRSLFILTLIVALVCSCVKTFTQVARPKIVVKSENHIEIRSFFPINHYWAQYASSSPFGIGNYIESSWPLAECFAKHPCSFKMIELKWIKGPDFLILDTWKGLTYYNVRYFDGMPRFIEAPLPKEFIDEDLDNTYLGKLRPSKPIYIEAQLPPKSASIEGR